MRAARRERRPARALVITVWRWLSQDAIKLWQYRSWIFPRDPDFTAHSGRILAFYAGRWEGELPVDAPARVI